MALNTNIYGFVIDPLFSFCDQGGKTIANGYVRVFRAGTSTPVLTYRNYDGAFNAETIELDNSGRTMTQVIASKGDLYKVCVYDADHSQEDPILTVDKVAVIGASVNATNIVQGLNDVAGSGWIKSVAADDTADVSLDPTGVSDHVDTFAQFESHDQYKVPLVKDDGSQADAKLGHLMLNTLQAMSILDSVNSASGTDYVVLLVGGNPKRISVEDLLELTAQNALAGNVAPAFDPTRTSDNHYKAGEDIVVYNGKLYAFKVDHYGAWSDDDALELSAAVSESIDVVVSKNLLPVGSKSASVNNVSASYEDGVLSCVGTANGNGGRTTHVTPDFVLKTGTYTFTRSATAGVGIVLQDSSNNILAQLLGTTTKATFTINANTTCYIGISTANATAYNITYNLQVVQGSVSEAFEKPSFYSITAKDNVARDFNSEVGAIYEYPTLSWTDGKAFIYNAGWFDNSGWSYADVELIQGQSLVIKMQATTVVYPLSVWNDEGTDIIKVCVPLETTAGIKDYVYKCSAQKEKVRINVLKSAKDAVVAKIYKPLSLVDDSNVLASNNTFKCYDVLFKEKGIIAIGDSLTKGSYTGYDIHETQSYPSFLADMMGVNVENAGMGGWSTLQWWQGDAGTQKGFPYYDYTEYNAAVICLGTNGGLTDTLDVDVDPYNDYNDYANTNTGAYCKIIEGMLDQNSGLQIVLCTIWATGADLDVTNSVIRKIAAKYNLSVVDLTLEFLTSFSVFHAVQSNIHLGRIGYARMADLIRIGLEKDVMEHPSGYNFIPS